MDVITGREPNPLCLLGAASSLKLGSHLVETINNHIFQRLLVALKGP